ncbi:nucleotide sugar dehydrogenase [Orrella marina]|uniref:Nucleotide sugar dehydrogenase n=1 Tax=Orrella marina TaxID=2163011 RepID=A0A2R4XJU1_9BURK|nr:nucleotide sugar dehydrogenase [Orrella marina]AWB34097.1 nucleotide sugar dehydrogenase [Orrella marina]
MSQTPPAQPSGQQTGTDCPFDIAVVGLGYVGLTLATVLAEVGFRVLGVEKRADVVNMTNQAMPHFSEIGLADALARVRDAGRLEAVVAFPQQTQASVYIITVGTPLDANGKVRLDMIEAASREVARNMQDDALVILRSTVHVGTARNVVSRILNESGKRFEIAVCPERTLEGKALLELRQLPQIVGADDQSVRERAERVFRRLTKSIVQVTTLESAEIIKLVDNTYRDLQFAFANEVARVCEAWDVNAHEVIASGKLGYERTNVALPGLVGGPCLEKDPHIFRQSAQARGIDLEITAASRLVNERQPLETVTFIVKQLQSRAIQGRVRVALLGMAFKGRPATDDLRGSMSLRVLQLLKLALPDAEIVVYDPVVALETLRSQVKDVLVAASISEAISQAHVTVIANNHPALGMQSPIALQRLMHPDAFIYDYWNHFSDLSDAELGHSYFAVGNLSGRA